MEKEGQGGRGNAPPWKKTKENPPCGEGRDADARGASRGRGEGELPSPFTPPPMVQPHKEECLKEAPKEGRTHSPRRCGCAAEGSGGRSRARGRGAVHRGAGGGGMPPEPSRLNAPPFPLMPPTGSGRRGPRPRTSNQRGHHAPRHDKKKTDALGGGRSDEGEMRLRYVRKGRER